MTTTTTAAHAKINLRHRVLERDLTGYHGVETLLLRTDLHDDVAIDEVVDGIELDMGGTASDGIPDGRENLCWRAASAFLAGAFPRARGRPGIRISLEKRIPAGSGLGGGSADAAAVLRLLHERFGRLTGGELIRIGGEIGSDVPFGVLDVPLALGWGRGRRLLPLRPPPPAPGLLVCPPIHVSTPEAYGWLAESRTTAPGGASVLPGPGRLAEWDSLCRLVRNDLQGPVLERHPELAAALAALDASGPRACGMTGSGSALFAVFGDAPTREAAAERLRSGPAAAPDWRLIEVRLPV